MKEFSLGQPWVSGVTRADSPEVSTMGADRSPLPEATQLQAVLRELSHLRERLAEVEARAERAEARLAQARALLALFDLPHFKGSPLLPGGSFDTTTVMVSAGWYRDVRAALAAEAHRRPKGPDHE